MTVADSGPLIPLARIGQRDLLHEVLGEILIPEAVYQEVVVNGGDRVGVSEIEDAQWIVRRAITKEDILESIPTYLHSGEREAVALAQENEDSVLIDERRGRAFAQREGIEVIGSLTVLARAKQQGIIELVTPIVESMLSSGYWIHEELVSSFLEQMGEANDQAK